MTDFAVLDSTHPWNLVDSYMEFLVDASGSMSPHRARTVEGLTAYMNKVKTESTGKNLSSMYAFDSSHYRPVNLVPLYENVDVAELNPDVLVNYHPNGGTPLYQVIGQRITAIETMLANIANKPSVLMVIQTDGDDTDGGIWRPELLKEKITKLTTDGWSFIFLGADQSAWEVSRSMGIDVGNTVVYDVGSLDLAMETASMASVNYANASTMLKSSGDRSVRYATRSVFRDADIDNAKVIKR